jgi:hypothetical protein
VPDFTPLRGHDAIEREVRRSGKFSPFAPQLTWQKDKQEKFILLISPLDKVYTPDLHEFIEVGTGQKNNGETYTKFESFVSRKSLGESTDPIQDRLGREPRRRSLGVGVELEPVYETVRGRQRPKSFAVKTETFTRKTDDGEVDVEAPVIGMVIQAQKNFYGYLVSYDRTNGPVQETPFQVIRRGTDSDTTYDFVPFAGVDVDLSPLFDNLDGIAYLRDEDLSQITQEDDDFLAAADLGTFFLEKRWEELIDEDRYHDLIDPIKELPPSRFGNKKSQNQSTRSSRPQRKSPRESTNNGGSEDGDRMAEFEKLRAEVGAE